MLLVALSLGIVVASRVLSRSPRAEVPPGGRRVRRVAVRDEGDRDHHDRGPAHRRGRRLRCTCACAEHTRAPRSDRRPRADPGPVWIDGVEYRATAAGDTARRGRPAVSELASIPVEHLAGAGVVFLVIYVLLYSSFFTNFPQGLIDSLATFTIWVQHSGATQVQPPSQYLQWMVPLDLPILVLGVDRRADRRDPGRPSPVGGDRTVGGRDHGGVLVHPVQDAVDRGQHAAAARPAGRATRSPKLWRSRYRLGVPLVLAAADRGQRLPGHRPQLRPLRRPDRGLRLRPLRPATCST